MTETVNAPVEQVPEKASLFEDLIDIIVAPAKVFARRVDTSVILIIALFTALALLLAFVNRGNLDAAVQAEIDRAIANMMEQNPQMTAEALGPARSWMAFSFTYGIAIGLPIYFLILALIVWGVSALFGAKTGFGGALMISVWSFVPRFLGMILFAIQGLVTDTSQLKGLMQASFGVGRFMDPTTMSPGMLALVARIEVFTFWSTILIGIGIAVVAKVPRAKGYAAAAAIWCVGALPAIWQLVTG